MHRFVAILLCLVSAAHADLPTVRTIDGKRFEAYAHGGRQFILVGGDITTHYQYVCPDEPAPDTIMYPGYSKAIEYLFHIDVPAVVQQDEFRKKLKKIWPKETLAMHQAEVDSFMQAMVNVKKSDTYMLVWTQANGLQAYHNGDFIYATKDANAATLLIAIDFGHGQKRSNREIHDRLWREFVAQRQPVVNGK